MFGGIAFALVAFGCAFAPYIDFSAPRETAKPRAVEVTGSIPSRAFYLDKALFDSAAPIGFAPRAFSQSAPLPPRFQLATRAPAAAPAVPQAATEQPIRAVQSVPLPTPRPVGLGAAPIESQPVQAMAARPKLAMASVAETPFDKLFGKRETVSPALAYAPTDGGVTSEGRSLSSGKLPPNDGFTAIYDITGQTVHLPDGTKLEAHSGLGPKMDNPRHAHVRMHGVTPPHVYDLIPREALFHGVEALRLIPVGGEGAIYGRTGLLTHTYLLGPRGDSNGCISFKDYATFLRAYKDGKVKRVIVVASLDDPQVDMRLAEKPPIRAPRMASYSLASETSTRVSPIQDDRYALSLSSSRASRTSSSARSLNSSPE